MLLYPWVARADDYTTVDYRDSLLARDPIIVVIVVVGFV